MKRKILLLPVMMLFITALHAQKKQQKQQTGYAITAAEKGGRNWKEVRVIDITTGQEVRSIYQSSQEVEPLNARTGKPIVKKESKATATTMTRKVVNLDQELSKAQGNLQPTRIVMVSKSVQSDKPFATNSAA